jgi:hypothetical protein
MNKWVLRVCSLIVAVLLLLMGTTTVMAAGTGEASQATETFLVEITVEGDGQWSLALGGMDMGIASTTFNALSSRFGLGLASPVVDSNMLKLAADAGVDELAVVKEGAQTAVWINGEPLTALTVTDTAVVALTEVYVPELEGLLSWVNKTYMTVILHLPSSSGSQALDLSKALGPIEEGEPTNVVSVAATVSPQGELLSVGGLAPSQLGLPAAWFDLSLLDLLGIQEADVSVGLNGVKLAANGEDWISLAWNPDMLVEKAPVAAGLSGIAFGEAETKVLDTATDWLDDTQVQVGIAIADTPTDEALTLSIGRPLMVEVAGNGGVTVEGFYTGMALDPQTAATLSGLGSAAVKWDGTEGELRLSTGGMPLPYLKVDEGFLPTAVEILAGGQDLGLPVSLDYLEAVLGNTKFSVGIGTEAAAPAMSELEYKAVPSAPTLLIVPQVKVAPNGIALFGEALPLEVIDALAGMDIGGWAGLYASAFAGNAVDVKLGPSGLRGTINGKAVTLAWDDTLRGNLVDLSVDQGGPSFGLPPNIDTGLIKTIARVVVGVVNSAEIGVEIEVSEEEIEPGFVQAVAGWIFPGY